MCEKHKKGNFTTNNLTPHLSQLVKYWLFYGTSRVRRTHVHCCSRSYWGYWPYWLASQWAQYLWRGIWTTYLLMRWCFLRNPILLFYSLIWFTNVRKWTGGYCCIKNVQLEDDSFFIKASGEEKILLFQHGEIRGKWIMVSSCMLDAGRRINDDIDPNWANEVCQWSVTITICSFQYIGKSKKLNYKKKKKKKKKKSAHDVISGSNHPP